jgi:xanthine dehydrogenase YagR molybdenum-binding subunit
VGVAFHKWGGRGVPREQMLVEINADGSVLVQSSTQDLGTGNRTVLAIVAAEVFGLQPDQIRAEIGESQWANSHGSGGSTTCPSTAPATLIAATEARDQLFAKIAPAFDAKPEDLIASGGQISVKGGGKSMSWKEAVRKLGMSKISAVGEYKEMTLSSEGVGGCQFAEVQVDEETGFVRVKEIVAVQDCGLIINKLGCESQVAGGVIMAINAALFEERVLDQATGRMLNPDMEFYKLGSISDMPTIKVHMFEDPISQSRGVIGIGEPPTISGLAAIGNAVFNALGVRVPHAPFTPRNVLAAIADSKGGVA